MMIRPSELRAIQDGGIDLAFRRWDRPRVVVGTQMRTMVGLVEVTSVEQVTVESLTEEDARRAGSASLGALLKALEPKADKPVWRVGVRHAGADPRAALRDTVPSREELAGIIARLERLDRASSYGAWTRETLDLVDRNPERRAPALAARVGRETAAFKTDVRKLKELGLTESLAIGYRLSPRGEAVVDKLHGRRRKRPPRPAGTPLPRSIGAPATRALRAAGLASLEALGSVTEAELRAMHGVGPIAIARLREALDDAGLSYRAT
jgi:hypothetical protein